MIGKLTHIQTVNQTSATAAVSVTGISDNSVHLLTINNLKTSNDSKNPRFRLTKTSDSSADSEAEYNQATRSLRTDTGFNNGTGIDGTSWSLGNIGTGTQEELQGFVYLYNLYDSGVDSYCGIEVCYINASQVLFGQMGGGVHTVHQSNNGVSIFEGGGDTITGTFSLYKVV